MRITSRRRRQRVRRWVLSLTALVVITIIVAVVAGYMALRASLPRMEGEIVVEGITEPVVIERDPFGIPTITAATYEDAAFGQGFVHAQDRYFQMDLARRVAAGELAELLGPDVLEVDEQFRVHQFRLRAERLLEQLPERHRRLIDGYVKGVRAGLADLGARPPEYLLLRTQPRPWSAVDTILVTDYFFLGLSFNHLYERQVGVMDETLPAELVEFLTPSAMRFDRPLVGHENDNDPTGGYAPPAIPGPAVVSLRDVQTTRATTVVDDDQDRDLVQQFGDRAPGSNSWAIAGTHTADGRAILANDPHLGLRVPPPWYRLSMKWEADDGSGVTVSGASAAGVPGVLIGATEHVAWGCTNAYVDQEDLIIVELDPADPDRYLTPDGPVEFTTTDDWIAIRGEDRQPLTIRRTIWGPVIGEDFKGRPLVLKTVAADVERLSLDLLDMPGAPTVDEAITIAKQWRGPSQNIIVADSNGRIGWTISGSIPNRVGFHGKSPQSWADGTCFWDSEVSDTDRPVVIDPEDGVLFTANSRTMALPEALQFSTAWSSPVRQHRITQLLDEADTPIDEQAMFDMQLDTRSALHDVAQSIVLEVIGEGDDEADPALRKVRDIVAQWNGTADADQAAFVILRLFHEQLREQIIGSLLQPCAEADEEFVYNWPLVDEPLLRILEERPMHLLPGKYESWDAYLRAIVHGVVDDLADNDFSPQLLTRSWGEVNRSIIVHPMSSAVPIPGLLNMKSTPQPGHATTVRVALPSFGASMRMAVSPGRFEDGILHMPGGQSGHFLSPHFDDSHDTWAHGHAAPFLPRRAMHRLTLVPR